MVRVIGLAGGDEFRVGCENMDREILASSGKENASVLIVPTAADANPVQAANHGVRYFTELGAKCSSLMVLTNNDANDSKIIQRIESADILYFTGGNPEYLLETIKGSILVKAINQLLEAGMILAGSSAGAMVMGSWMRMPSNDEVARGLDIVQGIVVLPHHENQNPEKITDWVDAKVPSGITALGIDAKSACLMTPKGWKVIGEGKVTVYKTANWCVYGPGSIVSW